jgi:hypothetical protein
MARGEAHSFFFKRLFFRLLLEVLCFLAAGSSLRFGGKREKKMMKKNEKEKDKFFLSFFSFLFVCFLLVQSGFHSGESSSSLRLSYCKKGVE